MTREAAEIYEKKHTQNQRTEIEIKHRQAHDDNSTVENSVLEHMHR